MDKKKKTERDYLKELSKEASWLGEDCDSMVCVSSTKRGAVLKFKRLMIADVGDIEAEEIKEKDVTVGWLRLPTEEDEEENGDLTPEWYVMSKQKSPYPVFVWDC